MGSIKQWLEEEEAQSFRIPRRRFERWDPELGYQMVIISDHSLPQVRNDKTRQYVGRR